MIARITPITAGLTEVLAVEVDERGVQVAVVAREGDGVVARRAASVDATGDLAGDLQAALAALGGSRPRRAVLVTARATAVVLQVPPIASLPAERVQGLVRYELEPYLHEALRDGGDLACGWGDRGEGGDRAGPLLVCGLAAGARDEAREAFRRAGLQLVGLYPQLGCAAALLAADEARDALVIEHAAGRLAASRVVDGQVERLVMQRAPGDLDELSLACRGLVEGEARLVVAGPADPDLIADLADLDPRRLCAPPIPPDGDAPPPAVSASLLGAARHALGLPGAARVAAIAAQAPRQPLLRQPAAQALIAMALPSLLAIGADLIVRSQLEGARAELAELQRAADLGQRAAGARKALERERDALLAELGPLKVTAAEHAEAEGRREWLLGLLRGVSEAAGRGVVVRAVEEEAGGAVRVEGVARAEVDVQAFVRDLAAAPVLADRPPRGASIQREEGRLGAASYRFEVRFGGEAAPAARRPTSAWGGD